MIIVTVGLHADHPQHVSHTASTPECVEVATHYASSLWGSSMDLSLADLMNPPANIPAAGAWHTSVDVTMHLVSKGKLKIEVPIGAGCTSVLCGAAADNLLNLDGWATDGVVHLVMEKIKSALTPLNKAVAVLSAIESTYNLAGKSCYSETELLDRQRRMMHNPQHQAMLAEVQGSDVVIATISHGDGGGAADIDKFKGSHWVFAAADKSSSTVVVYDSMAGSLGYEGLESLRQYGQRFGTLLNNWGCTGEQLSCAYHLNLSTLSILWILS